MFYDVYCYVLRKNKIFMLSCQQTISLVDIFQECGICVAFKIDNICLEIRPHILFKPHILKIGMPRRDFFFFFLSKAGINMNATKMFTKN